MFTFPMSYASALKMSRLFGKNFCLFASLAVLSSLIGPELTFLPHRVKLSESSRAALENSLVLILMSYLLFSRVIL